MLAAQVVHAAGESSPGGLCSGTHAVVLAARDERSLRELAACLRAASVKFALIEESDAPYAGAVMAIGLEPVDLAGKEALRRHLSSLPLLR